MNDCIVYKQPETAIGKGMKFERHRWATEVGSESISPGRRKSLPNTKTGFCHSAQS